MVAINPIKRASRSFVKRSLQHTIGAISLIAVALTLNGCFGSGASYAPWPDLSNHFDLSTLKYDSGLAMFNSYEISQHCEPFMSQLIDDRQYNAAVLGTGVCIRSEPRVAYYTKVCNVNTGDRLTVQRSAGYHNGKYWSYVYVNSGRSQGAQGFICTDYIIEHEKYEVVSNYILSPNSNISFRTESKYLNAIASVLLKFQVNHRHPSLFVSMQDTKFFGDHTIVTFQIQDFNIEGNNTMLAFVQFNAKDNDFVVLGVVPGSSVSKISRCPNGSYDIYFRI